MCDRIAIINKGNLVALDTTQKLLDRIKTKKIVFKVKKIHNLENLKLNGTNFSLDDSNNTITAIYEKNLHKFSDILEILKKNNLEILDISTDDGNLEDVFIQLTNN